MQAYVTELEDEEEAYVLERSEARDALVTDSMLRARRFRRFTSGWYATVDLEDVQTLCAAFSQVLPDDAVFSHATAAAVWGLPTPYLAHSSHHQPLHVSLTPRPTIPRRRELTVHRCALNDSDWTIKDGLRVTTVPRTFVDLAAKWPKEALVALGDAVLRGGLATREDLDAAIHLFRGRRGVRRAREFARLLDPRAGSPAESALRVFLADAGLVFEPQCPVEDYDGNVVGHADLGDRRRRILIEYEGRHHSEGVQFDRDIARYSNFSSSRYLVFRAGRRDLADRCFRLSRKINAALSQPQRVS